ncbi:MAG TPA: hypothetical protein VEH80_09600, partial [Candidatus Bathyarchaeia archaeon]|nr:hypothetical protein [Candidatus Bathyarchaeia archaeon]
MTARISRRRLLQGSALVAGGVALDGAPLAAAPAPSSSAAGPEELPRRVLAIYKSAELYNDVSGRRPKTATT